MSTGIDPIVFEFILDQALNLGLKEIKLTGGEPFLHPRIMQLLDIILNKKLRLTMETNGTLCQPEIAEKLAAFPDVFISVSLDGSRNQTHDRIRGKKGSFTKTVAGIKNLVACGIKPQIIMTVMRHNQAEIGEIVDLAESLGAGSVKFNLLQPTARGKYLHEAKETLSVATLIDLGKWVDGELSSKTSLSLFFHQPPAFLSLSRLFGNGGNGCQSCGILGILGILSDGSYALCGIGATVPELIFGHAQKDKLETIWHDHPLLHQIRSGLPQKLAGICSRCLMKNICLGSCLAQNYYRNHNLWAPFWYCEEAFQQGLFPESRMQSDHHSEECAIHNDPASSLSRSQSH